jgi:peptidoglycan/xylan/chitin deacetylase (PgdA/CDA1 family)
MEHVMNSIRALRTAVAPMAKSVLRRGGVYSALRRVHRTEHLAILRYHAICERNAGYAEPAICVTPAAFETHVRYLTRHYRVLPLDEAVSHLGSGRTLPPNSVVLTFDDGYADNLAAARILNKHGATATFYLTAGCLAGGAPFWPAEVRYVVDALARRQPRVRLASEPIDLDVSTPAGRLAAVRDLTRLYKSRTIAARDRVRDELRAAAGDPAIPTVMLTWDQVREMQSLGMSLGAHTVTHPNLPSAGAAVAAREIAGSKARIEQEIGVPITLFSYPNGGAERYFTPELQRIVREAGFLCATTSRNGFATRSSDPYALERVQVSEDINEVAYRLEVERMGITA